MQVIKQSSSVTATTNTGDKTKLLAVTGTKKQVIKQSSSVTATTNRGDKTKLLSNSFDKHR